MKFVLINLKTINMKNFNKFSAILLLSLSVLSISCSSDSDGGGGSGPATGGFIKAKVAGANFQSDDMTTVGTYNSGAMVLQGTTLDGKSVTIQLYAIDGSLETGTYNMNATNENDAYTGSLNYATVNLNTFTTQSYNSLNCENATGTLEVTFIDATKIEGTFSFVGKEVKMDESCNGATKNVTNGSFRLEL
jgi:hypothetical protein